MALNLFMLDQASRRAWRLGKREEVHIYYLTYANTAGHHKLRKLGQQSGAAAAFAGEPARGSLIEHAGADKTTLARLSSLLKQQESEEEVEQGASLMVSPDETEVVQEEAALKAVFARRAEELRAALVRGRTWLGGLSDTLEARLLSLRTQADFTVSVWTAGPLVPGTRMLAPLPPQPAVQLERHSSEAASATPLVPVPMPSLVPSLAAGSSLAAQDSVSQDDAPVLPRSPVVVSLPPAVPEPTPLTTGAIGSRAEVIFGRREHIALARVRRAQIHRRASSHDPVKRHQPVVVREIAALVASAEQERVVPSCTPGSPRVQTVMTPSLWEQSDPTLVETARAEDVHADEHTPLTLFALSPVRPQTRLRR